MKTRLLNGRHYLKTDFKLNIELDNRCPDHCMKFALSDGTICEHEHDWVCNRCDDLLSIFDDFSKPLQSEETKFR